MRAEEDKVFTIDRVYIGDVITRNMDGVYLGSLRTSRDGEVLWVLCWTDADVYEKRTDAIEAAEAHSLYYRATKQPYRIQVTSR